MDIKMLFKNLQEDEYGILRTDTQMPVSFPEEGNAVCFGLESYCQIWCMGHQAALLSDWFDTRIPSLKITPVMTSPRSS